MLSFLRKIQTSRLSRRSFAIAGPLLTASRPRSTQTISRATPASSRPGTVLVSTANGSRTLEEVTFTDVPSQWQIDIDTTSSSQPVNAYGGGLTHASASLLLGMPDKERDRLLRDTFGPDGRYRLNAVRIPLGTSDFTTRDASGEPEYYTFADERGSDADPLANFSIAQDEQTILPVLREILAIQPNLHIMLSPWTPPAWMKVGRGGSEPSLIGGELIDESTNISLYAGYLARSVNAYEQALGGTRIAAISVQNEPLHEAPNYPSMFMSPDMQIKVVRQTLTSLSDHSLDTHIYLYDHNWDRPDYPISVLTALTAEERERCGVAFHAYGGAADAGTTVIDAFPDIPIWFTEQTGVIGDDVRWEGAYAQSLRWFTENVYIGGFRNHHSAMILWNIMLDENGGPGPETFTNGTGLYQIDSQSGAVRPSGEMVAMAHFSACVPDGSVVIESYSPFSDLLHVAFKRPDGQTATVVYNTGVQREISVSSATANLTATIPSAAIATFTLA